MIWRLGILAAMWVLLWGSHPAAAAIRHYVDGQGVIHIGNVGTAKHGAHSPSRTPDQPSLPAPALKESPRKGPEELLAGFKKVAYARKEVLADVWGRLPARKVAGAVPGAIRRYRDVRGILHIENGPPVDLGPVDSRRWLAMTGAGKGRDQPYLNKSIQPGGQDEIIPRLAVKPSSWQDGNRAPPVTPQLMASRSPPILAGGTLRRYRDAQGVWHIESVEPSCPRAGPLPVQLADQLPGAVNRVFAGLKPGSSAAAALGSGVPAAVPGASRVVAYRDHRGRLKIVNQEADPRIARAPPMGGMLEPLILEAAQVYGLPPALIRAVIKVESNFVAWAVSPKGAMGLMQLMPGTADFLGVRDPFSPRENIYGGCRYLRLLLDSLGGSVPLALAAYNAGFQRVVNCGFQVPSIKETQDFVTRVLGLYYLEKKQAPWPWV
jgi:hypothetical protein